MRHSLAGAREEPLSVSGATLSLSLMPQGEGKVAIYVWYHWVANCKASADFKLLSFLF